MSTRTTKAAHRSPKAARQPQKKSAKRARATSKKTSKSARQPVGKTTRPAMAAPRAPAIMAKPQIMRTASPPVQPEPAHEMSIMAHKYRVGETVYYTSPTFGRAAATGSYTVVKLLPSEGDDYQYRIKSSGEAFERVAKESQLDRM